MAGHSNQRGQDRVSKPQSDPAGSSTDHAGYLTVEHAGERTLVLVGELDMASEAILRQALDDLLSGDGPVELNMAGVTFLDSSGTRVVIDAAKALWGRGDLTVTHPSPAVVRVFELFGLLPESAAIPLHVRLDDSVRSSP
jgi:anti-sigma B factor antagonist